MTRWLSTTEAARECGVQPKTLYKFIDDGQIPAYRFGRVIRLKESEVEAFVESCRIPAGSLGNLHPVTHTRFRVVDAS